MTKSGRLASPSNSDFPIHSGWSRGLERGPRQDNFTETGAGDLGLIGDVISTTSLRTAVGARIAKRFNPGRWTITPELRGRWVHEFADEWTSYHPTFIRAPGRRFEIQETRINRDRGIAGFGVVCAASERLSINVDYDVHMNADVQIHNVTVGGGGFLGRGNRDALGINR